MHPRVVSATSTALRRGIVCIAASMLAVPAWALDWADGPGFRRTSIVPAGSGTRLTLLSPSQTGIHFTNQLSETNLVKSQILEVGSGVALGDVDGDSLTDIYFAALEGGNRLFRNLGDWRFADITATANVACEGQFSTGCALADLDGDRDLDLLVTGIGAGTRCFLNDGTGVFKESNSNLIRRHGSTSMALADVNRDGFLDLYVANYHTRTAKDASEINVSVRQVQGRIEISPPGVFLPMYGKNGSMSLFERGEEDHLYLNDGKGGFRPIDWKSGVFLGADGQPLTEAPRDWSLSVMFRDMNGDGAPDLYVCNDFFFSPDQLWLNDGKGNFRTAPPGMIRHTSMSSMAIDFADVDRDGWDDFIVLDMMSQDHRMRHRQRGSLAHLKTLSPLTDPLFCPEYPRNTFYRNRGDGTYAEIAFLSGLEASEWTWSASFLDVDLDGYEDLLIGNGNLRNANDADATGKGNLRFGKLEPPNLLFRNQGDLTFRELGAEWGFNLPGISHGMALGDLDNDGDLDVVLNNLRAPAACYRNDAIEGRVAVKLRGNAPNTQGIGARITLKRGAVPSQSQEVISAGRYLSCDDGTRTFATGQARDSMTLEVRWPDGRRTWVEKVTANSIYEISQERSEPDEQPSSPVVSPMFENVGRSLRPVHQDADFDDWSLQPLLPAALSFGGPGVSWFDADQDGREDLFSGSGRGGNQVLFLNTRDGFRPMKRKENLVRDQTTLLGWRDASGARLLAGFSNYEDGQTNGSAVVEFHLEKPDRDQNLPETLDSVGPLALGVTGGKLTLFVGGRVRPGQFPKPSSSRIFKQDADGHWAIEAEATRVLADIGMVSSAVWGDLDGDGASELILACDWGPLRLFESKTGALVERTAALGLDRFTGRWNGVATGDFDGDGRSEIVASNWGRNTKYERHRARPLRVYYGDWNNDGRTDLLEAYYENTLGGYAPFVTLDLLREALPDLAARYPTFAGYGSATVEQILGDALKSTEIREANSFESSIFWWQEGKLVPRALPIAAQIAPAFGISVGDANGDGREDIFLSQNFFPVDADTSRYDGGQGLWLQGDGKGNFTPWTASESGVSLLGEQRGSALADFDQDGRIDLAIGQNRGPLALFRNLQASPGLRVRLRGPNWNPDGIGATVRLRFEHGWSPAKTVQTGSGYWSQASVIQVFGLPSRPVEVQVRWPDQSIASYPITSEKEVTVNFEQ